jgi:hypothetical protein
MKDLVIRDYQVMREIGILLICLILAEGVNAGAIIAYHRPWYELFTQIGYVVCFGLGLYVSIAIIRLLVLLIRKIFKI